MSFPFLPTGCGCGRVYNEVRLQLVAATTGRGHNWVRLQMGATTGRGNNWVQLLGGATTSTSGRGYNGRGNNWARLQLGAATPIDTYNVYFLC